MSTLRIMVYDHAGHPFQAQLARLLADRGHDVDHVHCAAYRSGKGKLESDSPRLRFSRVGVGRTVDKYQLIRRFFKEIRLGFELARLVRRSRPDVVLIANTPVPMLAVVAAGLKLGRTPWILWHQDVNASAVSSVAARTGSQFIRMSARIIAAAERWSARQAAHIVAIADAFLAVHERWGTLHKTTVIPNWAPLDEIVPQVRKNSWAAEHGLTDTLTLMYSGTLGLKHNPSLLVSLSAALRDLGQEATLVVVNEGPAVAVIRAEAAELRLPVVLLPFQPYERLSEVLASGDILIALLEPDASAFSVPSKTLSYLCAGRPVLGLLPESNAAAQLVDRASGLVLPPVPESVAIAAQWIVDIASAPEMLDKIGTSARLLAENEFSANVVVPRFEKLLEAAATR